MSLNTKRADKISAHWPIWSTIFFLVIVVLGLYDAKWGPYFHKFFVVLASHHLGASIISGAQASAPAPSWQGAVGYAVSYFQAIGIAIIVALIIASAVQTLIPTAWLLKVVGRSNRTGAFWAVLAAVPSMMCTCCSSPIVVSMAKKKAAMSAVLAYWLGNPLLNPATIIFMAIVLGWRWAALRIVMGSAMVLGVVMIGRKWSLKEMPLLPGGSDDLQDEWPSVARFFKVFAKLSMRLVPEYIGVVLVLGAARSWLFPHMTPAIGQSGWIILVLAIAGTLFVIPTAGEIPIVATMMHFGLDVTGAAVLMMTLPAISLPSMIMVSNGVSKRILSRVFAMVVVLGIVSGGVAQMFL